MSELSDQARELAAQGAEMRQETFGIDQDGEPQIGQAADNDEQIKCYFSPIRSQQQLEDANMTELHDGILRINKSEKIQPRIGQKFTLLNARMGGGDITVLFKEFSHSGINPEYVIGCERI